MKNNNNKNISDFKIANLKKEVGSSIYPHFLTYRSYLSVTEKSNTYDVSFPQASISKNNSVSPNQLKGLLPCKPKILARRFPVPVHLHILICIHQSNILSGRSRGIPEVVVVKKYRTPFLFPNDGTKRSKKCGKRRLSRSLRLGPQWTVPP